MMQINCGYWLPVLPNGFEGGFILVNKMEQLIERMMPAAAEVTNPKW